MVGKRRSLEPPHFVGLHFAGNDTPVRGQYKLKKLRRAFLNISASWEYEDGIMYSPLKTITNRGFEMLYQMWSEHDVVPSEKEEALEALSACHVLGFDQVPKRVISALLLAAAPDQDAVPKGIFPVVFNANPKELWGFSKQVFDWFIFHTEHVNDLIALTLTNPYLARHIAISLNYDPNTWPLVANILQTDFADTMKLSFADRCAEWSKCDISNDIDLIRHVCWSDCKCNMMLNGEQAIRTHFEQFYQLKIPSHCPTFLLRRSPEYYQMLGRVIYQRTEALAESDFNNMFSCMSLESFQSVVKRLKRERE
jgi:hypothetical protein